MIAILLPDWNNAAAAANAGVSVGPASIADISIDNTTSTSAVFDYKRSTVQRILTDIHANNRTTRNMYITDYIDIINKYELNAYYSGGMYGASNASSVSSIVDSSVIDSVSNTTIDGTDNNASATVIADTTATISDAALDNACVVSMCCSVQLQVSAECAKLEKAFKNITYRYCSSIYTQFVCRI